MSVLVWEVYTSYVHVQCGQICRLSVVEWKHGESPSPRLDVEVGGKFLEGEK